VVAVSFPGAIRACSPVLYDTEEHALSCFHTGGRLVAV
jgi:hypothetical protein